MADTLTVPDVETPTRVVDEGDHERCTHVVQPASAATEAMILGTSCTALCGKVWTPTRDPEQFPVCQGCIDVWEARHGEPWPGRR